jgi:hypothetical protein
MNSVTFSSKSKAKLDLLVKVAKEMGINASADYELTDEEMALPGPPVSRKQLDAWLAKDNGEKYTADEMTMMVREELTKYRARKKK